MAELVAATVARRVTAAQAPQMGEPPPVMLALLPATLPAMRGRVPQTLVEMPVPVLELLLAMPEQVLETLPATPVPEVETLLRMLEQVPGIALRPRPRHRLRRPAHSRRVLLQ